MMEIDIYYYLVLENMMPFTIGLDILQVKQVVLHKGFFVIIKELKLIHMILYLWKKK